jgi:DNA polymerase I-like protein with 3'-5' exonuclease and polymerase domains
MKINEVKKATKIGRESFIFQNPYDSDNEKSGSDSEESFDTEREEQMYMVVSDEQAIVTMFSPETALFWTEDNLYAQKVAAQFQMYHNSSVHVRKSKQNTMLGSFTRKGARRALEMTAFGANFKQHLFGDATGTVISNPKQDLMPS